MTVLLLLLTAHFIGDFYLQPRAWIENRHARGLKASALYKHSLIHFLLATLTLYIASIGMVSAIMWGLLIALTHWLIDWAKSGHHSLSAFILDQVAHIVVIVTVSAFITGVTAAQVSEMAATLVQPERAYLGKALRRSGLL